MPGKPLTDFLLSDFPSYHHSRFQNEYNTQFLLHSEPDVKIKMMDWLNSFKEDKSNKSVELFNRYREEGNNCYKSNKGMNALKAARCYTNAILAAPNDSQELAIAYGNRSAALIEFGYYKQAYEDCLCAIEIGDTPDIMEKIYVRQAFAAAKMRDREKLEEAMKKVRTFNLPPVHARQREDMEKVLLILQGPNMKPAAIEDRYTVHKISNHPRYGRYLAASFEIAKGDIILAENAFSMVPVECSKICSKCAASNIIPYPCNVCGEVIYCSLSCKTAHSSVHQYECYAYRSGLLKAMGITHLAMNTLLNGLPSIMPYLQKHTSTAKIWSKIETISTSDEKGYPQVLGLVTNLKHMSEEEVRSYSLAAGVAALYLMELTTFPQLFKHTPCSNFEWTVIVSALILRHTAQMMANAHSCFTPICLDNSFAFTALSDIWRVPYHIKKGQLHKYSRVSVTYAAVFPHLAFCNHSCDPSLRSKFDGDRVIAIARRNIAEGAQVFNSYMMDHRNNMKSTRIQELKAVFHFECQCKHCTDEAGDADYLKLFKFRCQNQQCEAIFLPPSENLQWFKTSQEETPFLTCPVCRSRLNLDWYWHFEELVQDPSQMSRILEIMNFSSQVLVDYNELRYRMSAAAVTTFFEAWSRGFPLTLSDFKEIGEIIKYWLDMIEQKCDVESVLYAGKSAFALDLMAQVDCVRFNCAKIRTSLEMLPTELRLIFDNYIDDYVPDIL